MKESASTDTSQLEIKKAAQLSVVEIGLGSIVHGLKLPLAGQFLSLNQLAFLLNAINQNKLPARSAFQISSIAAILKSFSAAGNKLGPMLSIAMQGFLFWFGLAIFGRGWVGQLAGAGALSLWAFIQPFITLFIIYGADLVQVFRFYYERIQNDYAFISISILSAISVVLAVKMSAAFILVYLSYGRQKEVRLINESQMQKILERQLAQKNKSVWKGVLYDLTRPFFIFSFLLMLVFIWQINGSWSQKIWLSLRPLATAALLFYVLRSPLVAQKLFQMSKKSKTFQHIYDKARAAAELLKSKQQ